MSNLKALEKLGLIQTTLKVGKDSKNTHGNYKYRSAEDILEALKPLSKEHNVTFLVTEELKEITGVLYIESTATMYDLESGENVSSSAPAIIELLAKGMHMPQRTGSAGSYAKKYALGNLCAIDDTKDSDATNTHEKTPAKPPVKSPVKSPAKSGDKKSPAKSPAPAKTAAKTGTKTAANAKAMTDATCKNFIKGIGEGKFALVKKKLPAFKNDANRKKVVTALTNATKGEK